MERKPTGRDLIFDADGLVHPSQVFDRPEDVVNDPDLSLNEKRAILASWASDACAIEAAPALRESPTGRLVEFDEIMDALRTLDRQAQAASARPNTVRRHLTARNRGSGRNDEGSPLH
jgi:hypothetical protein